MAMVIAGDLLVVSIVGYLNLMSFVGNFVEPATLIGNRSDFRIRGTGVVVLGTEIGNFDKAVCCMNYYLTGGILETQLCIRMIFWFADIVGWCGAAFGAVVAGSLGNAGPYWECCLCTAVCFVGMVS